MEKFQNAGLLWRHDCSSQLHTTQAAEKLRLKKKKLGINPWLPQHRCYNIAHWYRRGHGFKSCSGLNFFSALILQQLKPHITVMSNDVFISFSAVQIHGPTNIHLHAGFLSSYGHETFKNRAFRKPFMWFPWLTFPQTQIQNDRYLLYF